MRHRVRADLFGDLDLALGNQRAGDRGAQQILPLVQRIRSEHRKNEIADESFAQVIDEDFLHAEHLGLLACRPKLLALAEVGGKGDHLAAVGGLQPPQDHAGVQPAGIGEHDFLHILDNHGGGLLAAAGRSAPVEARQAGRAFPIGRDPCTLLT